MRQDNVRFRLGDGYRGWPEQAPFDAILVTAAPPEIPPMLYAQLSCEGQMVIPVGMPGAQQLLLIQKTPQGMHRQVLEPVSFVPLVPAPSSWPDPGR